MLISPALKFWYFSHMIQVAIIGGGNVASHIYKSFSTHKQIEVRQVFNRNANRLSFVKDPRKRIEKYEDLEFAHVYIIAVKDEAIEEVVSRLPENGSIIAHTSGSVPMNAINRFKNFGVFYPLQTFSKDRAVNFEEIPLCLEANSDQNLQTLKKLAGYVSRSVFEVNSKQRRALHLSAVLVNNFTNHLYTLAADYCSKNELPFKILLPLIRETSAKIETLTPFSAQTGPALRNDTKTIETHLEMLDKDQKKIYTILTQSIQKLHGKKL